MVAHKQTNAANIRTVIADDEQMALEYLRLLLSRIGGVDVVAEATTAPDCVRAVTEESPDAVFLDIRMPDENGIGIARALSELAEPPLVVFITGYDEYAVPAFDLGAVDYVVKPLTQERLEKALKRLRARLSEHRTLMEPGDIAVGKLAIRVGDTYELVAVGDITYIGTQRKKTVVYTASESYPTHYTLAGLEHKLKGFRFYRVNEGSLVNLDKVSKVVYYGPKSYELLLSGPRQDSIPISRSRLRGLREALDF